MLTIFDSHSHYTDHAFDEDRLELLREFPKKGVIRCMVAASDIPTAKEGIALAEELPELILTAVGVHPELANDTPDDYLKTLRELAKHPSVMAIGEIGLDYHYENFDKSKQITIFREQLSLAKELNLPVILHCRDAMGDMLEILHEFAPLDGVMHCFPGSPEVAQEVLKMGLYIGFTGLITFQNAKKPLAALRSVPLERLLLETDCPYMAPVPYRGKRCDSTMIPETAAVMAREKDVTTEEILNITAENAARLFRVTI